MNSNFRFSSSVAVAVILATVVWVLFYPGTFSVDSLYAYREAITGRFSDARPPLLAFVIFLFLKAGGTIGLFTLLESLLGYLGVRFFLMSLVGQLGAGRTKQERIASFGLLLLSSPLTPLPIYFITLWFDSWLVILLLWVLALILAHANHAGIAFTRRDIFSVLLIDLLILLIMLIRWNSVVLYPILVLLLTFTLLQRSVSRKWLVIIALSPMVAYFIFLLLQYRVVKVKPVYAERVVIALDLASMIVYDPSVCENLELQSCDLIQGKITPKFVVGNGAIDHTINQGLRRMEPAFMRLAGSQSLKADMYQAAIHFPWTYVKVKFLNFVDYLKPRPRYYFQSFIHPNQLGLYSNLRFESIRNWYVSLLHSVYTQPILKMVSFAHITWMLFGIGFLFHSWVLNRHSTRHVILGGILLVPLCYDFSYLLALTASDFRFMYPSTLLIQIITICCLTTFSEQRVPAAKGAALSVGLQGY